jgi:hypothetical protein
MKAADARKNGFTELAAEVARFREWAATYPYAGLYGEWECDYRDWTPLTMAFERFVAERPFELWHPVEVETVLYAVARDNEMGVLADRLAEKTDLLLFVARASVSSSERDAKWQMAYHLGLLGAENPQKTAAEAVLLLLVHDGEEYVRRCALIALGNLQSAHVEQLAVAAWDRPDEWQEYQRMAVLDALHSAKSSLLEPYLEKAEQDGRASLRRYADRIRKEGERTSRTA